LPIVFREHEKKILTAAVTTGNSTTGHVLEEIKVSLDNSEHPQLSGAIRKSAALQQALL
jgi:hypothetical protein